jgi:6-pyruvoyltetrahydropterin/6-carboxytetrahydropterin synthase
MKNPLNPTKGKQGMLTIKREYRFEAGHFLPNVPDGHKCKRQHGHNYRIEVEVGPKRADAVLNEQGLIVDFWELDKWVKPAIDLVDHRNLNDIEGLQNPTAEHIAMWFFQRINQLRIDAGKTGIAIYAICVWEVDGSCAIYDVRL